MPVELCKRCGCDLTYIEVSSNPSICQRCKPDFDIERKMADEEQKLKEKEVEDNLNRIRNKYL